MLTDVKIVDEYFGENDVEYVGNIASNKPGVCKYCMTPIKYGFLCKQCAKEEADRERYYSECEQD